MAGLSPAILTVVRLGQSVSPTAVSETDHVPKEPNGCRLHYELRLQFECIC